jgi:hypothetical protein
MKALRTVALVLAASAGLGASALAPAGAQPYPDRDGGGPAYRQWQPDWDRGEFDRNHIMIGTVVKFTPFRLELARENGDVQTIDLKNGTIIRPVGATPTRNERVAVEGFYSRGTFVANRIIIRG